MTSKERVRRAMRCQPVDRVPAAFEAVSAVSRRLCGQYHCNYGDLLDRYRIDILPTGPAYIGPKLRQFHNAKGQLVQQSWWGYMSTRITTSIDEYDTTTEYPLARLETMADLNAYSFPDPDWFDYSPVARACEQYPDRAILIGHEGPFQIVTYLMPMEKFLLLMVEEPEIARALLDRMVDFEIEYYRRCFEAGAGKIDILRPHDDYGTQISLLFSPQMWREYFRENTVRLVDLAHHYGAFYQQHSCGCVGALIPDFIACGVDALEPLQHVKGLCPEDLVAYAGKIAFHGGIDTQHLLPCGTPEEVRLEAEKYVRILGGSGGYILMASQAFEPDVPTANIEAIYAAERRGERL